MSPEDYVIIGKQHCKFVIGDYSSILSIRSVLSKTRLTQYLEKRRYSFIMYLHRRSTKFFFGFQLRFGPRLRLNGRSQPCFQGPTLALLISGCIRVSLCERYALRTSLGWQSEAGKREFAAISEPTVFRSDPDFEPYIHFICQKSVSGPKSDCLANL